MRNSSFRRAFALFLACQPVLWMSRVAYAQALQAPYLPPAGAGAGATLPTPSAPGDTEVVRGERGIVSGGIPAPAPIDEPLDPDKYVCGTGDVLELNYWGVQNFKLRVAIDAEGRAFVAKIGYLPLRGKTLTEVRHVLRESVARYYPALSFDVGLAEPRTFLVQVVDFVAAPGAYPSRALDRVSTVIGKAGGTGAKGSKRLIEIRHRDGTVTKADLVLYALTGDLKYNPHLLDGDVVRVPVEDVSVTIDGGVNRPGRYELIDTRDVAELVALAGGLSSGATKLLPMTLVRRQTDDRNDLKLLAFEANGELPLAPLQQNDAVRVPVYDELQRSIVVIGALAGVAPPAIGGTGASTRSGADEATTTRRLPFVQGDSVRTLLERVGGVGPLADLKGAYVLRDGKSVPVDLYSLVMLHDLKADVWLELGDTVVVPFQRRNILVEGAVFAPGSYPYNPNFGVEQYLALAGGRNRFAQPLSDVRLITARGETLDYKRDLKVEPGSSLVVPERNFSRAEVVQIMLGVASLVISGVAITLAARK